MQKAGLEWLFRLASEPARLWRRYLLEGPAIFRIWWRWRLNSSR
jgi:UDP-N-acetyl-D-mannosaminuronic acid transferase (WecB/TagA/CpsF family)